MTTATEVDSVALTFGSSSPPRSGGAALTLFQSFPPRRDSNTNLAGLGTPLIYDIGSAVELAYSNSLGTTWTVNGKINHPKKTIQVNAHFDIGACAVPEDRIAVTPHLIGVADGVSPGYVPGSSPKEIYGTSYGRYAADKLAHKIISSTPNTTLEDVVRAAHESLQREFLKAGCAPTRPAEFGATTAALCKINSDTLELMSWGDAYFVVFLKDGSIKVSKNWVYQHDQDQNKMRAEIARDRTLDKAGIWRVFIPALMALRSQRVNNPADPHGYGVLNGLSVEGLLQLTSRCTVPISDVSKVLLVTDGVIDLENTRTEEDFVRYMSDARGTTSIQDLKWDSFRAIKQRNDKTVVSAPEASGILLTF